MNSIENRTTGWIGVLRGLSRRAAAAVVGGVLVVGLGLALTVQAVAGLAGPDAPANATPQTAVVLSPNAGSLSGTTVGATPYGVSDGGVVDSTGNSVWFSWTPETGGQMLVLPQGMGATLPSVGIYTGEVGSLVAVAATHVKGKTSFTAAADTRYLLQISTRPGKDLDFQYTLWATSASGGPDNDAFAAAISLNPAVDHASTTMREVTGTLTGATTEDDEPHAGAGATVWYSWSAPNSGASLEVAVDGGRTLRAYTVPESDATDEQSGPQESPIAQLASAAGPGAAITLGGADSYEGQTVYLRVSGDAASGEFALTGEEAGYRAPDLVAPVVTCADPSQDYERAPSIACTATDSGSGIAQADGVTVAEGGIGRFSLAVDMPEGSTTTKGRSVSKVVCDVAGNCTTAGPVAGIKVDDVAPRVSCDPVPATWQTTATVSVSCVASDGEGSGVVSADETFVLSAVGIAGEANRAVSFSPHGTATASAPLGEVCDRAGNCTPITLTGGTPADNPSGPSGGATATEVTAMIDLAAPTIDCDTSGLGNDWKNDDVTVACTAADDGSGLADQDQTSVTLSTDVGEAMTVAQAPFEPQTVCDVAGNCVVADVSVTVKIDRTVPVVDCTVPAPGTWVQGRELTVPCTASDDTDGSGLAEAERASFDLIGSTAAGTQSAAIAVTAVEVCDVAGNCASTPSIDGVGLDDRAPQVSCGTTPAAWSGAATLSVACIAEDGAGSGLVVAADAAFELSSVSVADGAVDAHVTFTGRSPICDQAGNCAEAPTPGRAKVDRKTPAVTCEVPQTPAAGYFVGEVRVTCSAEDADSGLRDPANATFTLVTNVGPGQDDDHARVSSRLVYDVAGNVITAGAEVPSFRVRRSAAVGVAAPAFANVPGQVTVLAGVGPDVTSVVVPVALPAATSGLQFAVGCTPGSGDSFPMGETMVSCTARDTADQTSDADFAVRVSAAPQYALTGPLSQGGALPVAGGGFSGPVSVELDGTSIATLTPKRGVVGGTVDLPAATLSGPHLVVLRGVGADANPRLIVTPLVVTGDPVAPPTLEPEPEPTEEPTGKPTDKPTAKPTDKPTAKPTDKPTAKPTVKPTAKPTSKSTTKASGHPAVSPSPSALSTTGPAAPTVGNTGAPSSESPSASVAPGSTSLPSATPSAAPDTKVVAGGREHHDSGSGSDSRFGLWAGAGVVALLIAGGGLVLWRRKP